MGGTLRVIVLLCLAQAVAWGQPAERRALQAAVDRFDAIDITGRKVAMQDLRGRVVLLDFWATWCPPCLAEIPTLREVQRRFGDRVAIVGVSVDVQDRASFIAWLRRQEIDWPQVFDGRGWTGPTVMPFELSRVPFSVLVGTDGRVVGVDVRGERLLRSLDVLLDRVTRTPETDPLNRTHAGSILTPLTVADKSWVTPRWRATGPTFNPQAVGNSVSGCHARGHAYRPRTASC